MKRLMVVTFLILKVRPVTRLVKFTKKCKDKKLRAFSTYCSLKEVLTKYNIGGNSTDTIPLFSLQTYEIKDSDKHFEHCMAEILIRLKNYGSLIVNSLKAMCNEYVVMFLHTAINITRDSTGKELSMRPEYKVIGDDSTGQVDFAIKTNQSEI
ncbi:12073_t:CDS:2 [Funneliformis caledonium]|uniref:12073_t:CDS:1 n=1 Tax=Funneliformis caledonium TaxID=1117310 RepID=A0A9N8W4Q3_9GLOM|nr:12073_t:CDS:2 [Funneliformis caledonium]